MASCARAGNGLHGVRPMQGSIRGSCCDPKTKGNNPPPNCCSVILKPAPSIGVHSAVGDCVLRIDAQALKPTGSVSLKVARPSGPGAFSRDSLFVAQQSATIALTLDSGAARTLSDPNYRFQVLGAHGGDVIALADRVGGSTQYLVKDTLWMGLGDQLMALDASVGKITCAWP